MNQNETDGTARVSAVAEENPWKNRGALPPLSPAYRIPAAIACTVCGFAIPHANNEAISLAVLAILFVCTLLLVRRPLGVAVPLASVFLVVSLTGGFDFGFGVGSVFLSLVVGCAALAWLMTTADRPYLFLPLPIIGAALAIAFGASPRASLLGLAFLPAAVLLFAATRLATTRTSAICFATGGLLLSVLAVLGVCLWDAYGSIAPSVISQAIADLRESLLQSLIHARDELMRFAMEDASESAMQLYEQMEELATDAVLRSLVETLFVLLPGLVVAVCSVIAFEAQQMLNGIYLATGWIAVLTRTARTFTVSLSAAIIYSACFFLSFLLDPASLAAAVTENMMLILMPGLALIGWMLLLPIYARARGGLRIFLLLCAAFVICCSSAGIVYLLATLGAYHIIMSAIRQRVMKQISGDGGDNRED